MREGKSARDFGYRLDKIMDLTHFDPHASGLAYGVAERSIDRLLSELESDIGREIWLCGLVVVL